jgi:hypothetical protein
MRARIAVTAAFLAVVALAGFFVKRGSHEHVACGPGFFAVRARCCPGPEADPLACLPSLQCPPPLVLRGVSCDAPDERVRIPETRIAVGPSDGEAAGRVVPRLVQAGPFDLDAFEATTGHMASYRGGQDGARAANRVTRSAAMAYCKNRGGRLPTEDEWVVAAAGPSDYRRYPWGDTGAVCRRAAWGLAAGPCSNEGNGPDTVGAHPSGDTPSGLHDMAGNVAEWVVESKPFMPSGGSALGTGGIGLALGGSWQSTVATELRTWERLELSAEEPDPRVGVRCAYDVR